MAVVPMATPVFKIFALGSNGSGQLGIGHEDDTATPQLCNFDEEDMRGIDADDRILKIAAGGSHTLVLFKSGAVFVAGSNKAGQCYMHPGVAQTSIFKRVVVLDWNYPVHIPNMLIFVDISATWEASFLLDTDGRVFSCGTGLKGELGRGEGLTKTGHFDLDQDVPLCLFYGDGTKIKSLHSGMRHSVAITNDGEVFGWGNCRNSELGEDLEQWKEIWSPLKLSVLFVCQEAALGRTFTVVFSDSACKVSGRDQALQGIAQLKHLPSHSVKAGWGTVYTLINKRIKAFGRNDRGQWPSDDLPDLSKLAAGSEHCLGLTIEGQVVAWGWDEHGNCGQHSDSHGNVANRWIVLPIPLNENETVVNVAAGCATSFVVVGKEPS